MAPITAVQVKARLALGQVPFTEQEFVEIHTPVKNGLSLLTAKEFSKEELRTLFEKEKLSNPLLVLISNGKFNQKKIRKAFQDNNQTKDTPKKQLTCILHAIDYLYFLGPKSLNLRLKQLNQLEKAFNKIAKKNAANDAIKHIVKKAVGAHNFVQRPQSFRGSLHVPKWHFKWFHKKSSPKKKQTKDTLPKYKHNLAEITHQYNIVVLNRKLDRVDNLFRELKQYWQNSATQNSSFEIQLPKNWLTLKNTFRNLKAEVEKYEKKASGRKAMKLESAISKLEQQVEKIKKSKSTLFSVVNKLPKQATMDKLPRRGTFRFSKALSSDSNFVKEEWKKQQAEKKLAKNFKKIDLNSNDSSFEVYQQHSFWRIPFRAPAPVYGRAIPTPVYDGL